VFERTKAKYKDDLHTYGSNINYYSRNHIKIKIDGFKSKEFSERYQLRNNLLPEDFKPQDEIDYLENPDGLELNDILRLNTAQLMDPSITANIFKNKIKQDEHYEKYCTEYVFDSPI